MKSQEPKLLKFCPTFLLALSMGLSLLSTSVSAQEAFPSKRITLIVPFPAGSATDNTARRIGQELAKSTNQTVIVDNKPGGDGNIAAMQAVRSDPDGHTIFITTNSTQAANINLFKSLPFDPYKDLAPVTGLVTIPIMLVVRADRTSESPSDFAVWSDLLPVQFGEDQQRAQGVS